MFEDYMGLRAKVAHAGVSGEAQLDWPHAGDMIGPGMEIYGMYQKLIWGTISDTFAGSRAQECDAEDVATVADTIVHGLKAALTAAIEYQAFAHEYNRCLSAGPGCMHEDNRCGDLGDR